MHLACEQILRTHAKSGEIIALLSVGHILLNLLNGDSTQPNKFGHMFVKSNLIPEFISNESKQLYKKRHCTLFLSTSAPNPAN